MITSIGFLVFLLGYPLSPRIDITHAYTGICVMGKRNWINFDYEEDPNVLNSLYTEHDKAIKNYEATHLVVENNIPKVPLLKYQEPSEFSFSAELRK